MSSKRDGRYQLVFKMAGHKPQPINGPWNSMEQVLTWLRNFHKSIKWDAFKTGQAKYYFIDKLTGHEVGSTLDLIDKEK